jgi:hypothetical protein
MEADAEPQKFNLVLPSQILPPPRAPRTRPTSQFLVGYRNVLTLQSGKLNWALAKSSQHCGRAFVFEITEN